MIFELVEGSKEATRLEIRAGPSNRNLMQDTKTRERYHRKNARPRAVMDIDIQTLSNSDHIQQRVKKTKLRARIRNLSQSCKAALDYPINVIHQVIE